MNLFTPVNELESASSVDDAVLSVAVIVTGDDPIIVNDVHDAEPEHDAVVVAIVFSSPVEPMYVKPCDRDESRSADENVDDAVENRPLVKPITVDVEL